jgi:hypothetical protein
VVLGLDSVRLDDTSPRRRTLPPDRVVEVAGMECMPPPTRQFVVFDEHGVFVARVDPCWSALGIFIQLGGRFTWHEVTRVPKHTARRLAGIVDQAKRRPLVG